MCAPGNRTLDTGLLMRTASVGVLVRTGIFDVRGGLVGVLVISRWLVGRLGGVMRIWGMGVLEAPVSGGGGRTRIGILEGILEDWVFGEGMIVIAQVVGLVYVEELGQWMGVRMIMTIVENVAVGL